MVSIHFRLAEAPHRQHGAKADSLFCMATVGPDRSDGRKSLMGIQLGESCVVRRADRAVEKLNAAIVAF
jgi:hypothetical protein